MLQSVINTKRSLCRRWCQRAHTRAALEASQ
jgi:hypothetical protein